MKDINEVRQLVQNNINQIKISEFVAEGGWPNIDNIDVTIFNQKQQDDSEIIDLHILYTVDKAGCCFIPGMEEEKILAKTVTINNNKVKIE